MKKRIVVFTGAGMSADSGISTFRDADGLWANYRIEDVCTPQALTRNRELVIEFYNIRRKELLEKAPNDGHLALVDLERDYDVEIVTQNVDDLHERAGSTKILHLHGELRKLRSSHNEQATIELDGWEQKMDTRHADGSLLRPYIVFFGEAVPMFEEAIPIAQRADILLVIGTSLNVYPAASLLQYVRADVPIYVVDPADLPLSQFGNRVTHIQKRASEGVREVLEILASRQTCNK